MIEMKKEEALKIVDNAIPDGGRIHCFLSVIGCDWDKEAVIETINESQDIAWIDDMFGHDFAVLSKGKLYRFDLHKEALNN